MSEVLLEKRSDGVALVTLKSSREPERGRPAPSGTTQRTAA